MNFLSSSFHLLLEQPLFNILIFIYNLPFVVDIGFAIIILTILIKFIIYPLNSKAIRSQKRMAQLDSKIKEIKEKHKDDKSAQAEATMNLYKEEGINPFGGCLPLLIQLPILLALFRVFIAGFQGEQLERLYPFVQNPEVVDIMFLGVINLSESFWFIALLAGALQFIQIKMTAPKSKKKSDMALAMQKQMQIFMPAFTVFILFQLSSAVGLYWITTTLFTIFQQKIIFKKNGQD